MSSTVKSRPRAKHVPQRTCVSCGTATAKRELVRLVRTPEGDVEVDPAGKRSGRGAYLCHQPQCWKQAVRKGRLQSSLRAKLSPSAAEAILRYADEHLQLETS